MLGCCTGISASLIRNHLLQRAGERRVTPFMDRPSSAPTLQDGGIEPSGTHSFHLGSKSDPGTAEVAADVPIKKKSLKQKLKVGRGPHMCGVELSCPPWPEDRARNDSCEGYSAQDTEADAQEGSRESFHGGWRRGMGIVKLPKPFLLRMHDLCCPSVSWGLWLVQ